MAPDLLSRAQRVLHEKSGADFEELASQCVSSSELGAIVEYLASELRKVSLKYRPKYLSRCVELLAWLLVYKLIEPTLVLEAMIMTEDFSALTICGTADFHQDVLNYLKIDPQTGKPPQFVISNNADSHFDTDLLDGAQVSTDDSTAANKSSKKRQPIVHNPEWESDARRILLGSISAAESVRKITDNFVKNSEDSVIKAVFRITLEPKVYNRIMGNTMIQLLQDRRWPTPFVAAVDQFFAEDICLISEIYRLKVFGQFLGHVLSAHLSLWPHIMPIFDLESSASARIVILSVLQELKAGIGAEAVRQNVLGLPNISGLTVSELAGAFWEMAGLPGIVE